MSVALAETLAALRTDEHRTLAVGAPAGTGWSTITDAVHADGVFDHWYATVRTSVLNHRDDVTASYVASFLGDLLATPLARALLDQRRAWRYDPATTWVHLADDGWFDGLALEATVFVLPDDRLAGSDGVESITDVDRLAGAAFGALVDVLAPLFAMTRARAPYGLRGMWSSIADSIVADATWTAHEDGRDVVAARDQAMGLVDAFAAVAPTPITRPTLDRVDLDGHVAHLTTRGTCCLYYRSLTDPTPEQYCTSCPLGTDADRELRRVNWLRRQLAT